MPSLSNSQYLALSFNRCTNCTLDSSADYRLKLKESENYIDLARELEKLWKMKVTVIPIIIGALGIVTKDLVKRIENMEIRGWVEIIQIKTLLRSARILRRVLETGGDLVSLRLQ